MNDLFLDAEAGIVDHVSFVVMRRLAEAVRAVKRLGRKLAQRAMYFEVAGCDGVQILRID